MAAQIHVPLFNDTAVVHLEEHDGGGGELEVVVVPGCGVSVDKEDYVWKGVVVLDYVG